MNTQERYVDHEKHALQVNCPRCGEDFDEYLHGDRMAKICRECRKPAAERKLKGLRKDLFGQPLTVRERQIILLICDALLNKEIADRLHLAEGTIKVFVSNIFAKTGLSNRTALAVWAVQKGWYSSK